MSQQNVQGATTKPTNASDFMSHAVLNEAGVNTGEGFFTPISADLIDNLLGRYALMRQTLTEISDIIRCDKNAQAVSYFLSGNRRRMESYPPVREMFDVTGAVAALNAEFWQSALNLTDVYEYMPNQRRNEWNNQIHEMKAPEFEENTVRATLSELLFSRQKFFSERVDGIFRSLSGEHVTNRPEGFSKRMIISRVFTEWGTPDYERSGYVDDLRKVIARFMGRDTEGLSTTNEILKIARQRSGEWLTLDGGALRIKAFIKGTVHAEIHPDMAWRLNDILAFLYPSAIPADKRQKPRIKDKKYELITDLLPFTVLYELSEMETQRHEPFQHYRGESPRQPVTANPFNRRFKWSSGCDVSTRSAAEDVLLRLGGVKMDKNAFSWFEFDYDPTTAIENILLSGAMPDVKTHQYYPTNEKLAKMLIDDAIIGEGETCLEPSAGMGGLADRMPKEQTTCVEVSPLRCRVLEAKGYQVINADFLKWATETTERFDVVVMNPPFSEGRAAAHVTAAGELVKSGGRLAAILPSGSERKELLSGWDCNWSEPHHGEFAGAGVSVVRLIAYKPQ